MINRHTRAISVTSGKGGVGKTTVVVNTALALSQQGKQVLILDADLGMANVDIFFGIRAHGTIADVLEGKKSVREVLVEVTNGVDLLSGGSGLSAMGRINHFQRRALFDELTNLPKPYDCVLIDTAPGIGDNVLYFNSASDETVVIITPDPASLTDSYALIKVLHQEYKENHFRIICNMVRDADDGRQLFAKFNDICQRFLNVGLDFIGSVPADEQLKIAARQQRPILKHANSSACASAIRNIAKNMSTSARPEGKQGIRAFWGHLVGVA
ncbi:MAG: MinD/ParA family protein [Bdellovibrionaceae bacterium]|nr:MinD/ParA family protein [Pseudobdellovibrionaceae bacterium]